MRNIIETILIPFVLLKWVAEWAMEWFLAWTNNFDENDS
jgi:hypothetical protein